jgi:hypothetical protein
MAKRKTLKHELHQGRARNPDFDALYQRELAQFQLARQIARLRERTGFGRAVLKHRVRSVRCCCRQSLSRPTEIGMSVPRPCYPFKSAGPGAGAAQLRSDQVTLLVRPRGVTL